MNSLLTLENGLRLAGFGHFAILSATALVPSVLDWKNALKVLPPFLRTLFWVYGGFIVVTIIGFGTLTLCNIHEMAAGRTAARSLAGFISMFWGLRLVVQLFVFDARAYLTHFWLKLGDHVLTLAFVFFTIIYGMAALRLF